MPNFSIKFHFGRFVGVLWGQLDVDLIEASVIGSVIWSLDVAFPMPEIPIKERDLDS